MMIISKEQQDIVLNPVKTTSKDLLIMKGNLKSFKVTIILVYLSVIRNEVEKKNQSVLKEIRKGIHDTSEDELIFILGDFNAHLGIIGDQDVNYNGRIVLDMMTEDNMILLNDKEKCKGIYTWGREDQKVPLILYL